MKNRARHSLLALALAALSLVPTPLLACAVCMGGGSSSSTSGGPPLGSAINTAIFMLLGIVLSIGAGFFAFLLYLAKRDKLPPAPNDDNLAAGMMAAMHEGKHHA